jgi:predicted AlkP superfamily pyrophosphatase or phosphodiesterase
MLPSPPKSLGMLGDVLISAKASVLGVDNPLNLAKRRSVCVILVDGLGLINLKESGAHAGFLNSQTSLKASCFYPSTTSTSIVSFATGKPPWENGFIGYQVYDRDAEQSINFLSGWESQEQAMAYTTTKTISEQCADEDIEFHTVSQSIYKDSGFTAATTRGSKFHGTKSIGERFETALKLLADPTPKLVYLYIPELDQAAHAYGWKSTQWRNLLEDLDAEVSRFSAKLPKNTAALLTADHGVIDVASDNHIYLDEYLPESALTFVGGDTRGLFLYLKEASQVDQVRVFLDSRIGMQCYVATPAMLIAAGYWKEISKTSVVPDLIVLAKSEVALYHRSFAKKKSLDMVGHHGSISNQEMAIPLMQFGF